MRDPLDRLLSNDVMVRLRPGDLERWEKSVAHALTGAATGFEGRALAGTGEWVRVRSYLWPTWDRDAVVGITVAADGR